jgi:transcriptional regulator with XRE-family HTH domain
MDHVLDFSIANSKTIAAALGEQIRNIRLSRNITQAQLAEEAGVTVLTIGRLEQGEGSTLDTFVRVLIALGLAQNLSGLLPDPSIRPMERISGSGVERQRARPDASGDTATAWSWGDEADRG